MMTNTRAAAVAVLTLLLAFNAGPASAATKTTMLRISGMTCEGCATSIEKVLKDTAGVLDVRISYEKGRAFVKYDDQKVTVARLRKVVEDVGFKVAAAPRGRAESGRAALSD